MIRFLRSLFRPNRDRAVFRYFTGTRTRGADPLKLRRALDAARPGWARDAEELVSLERAAARLAAAGLDVGPELAARGDQKREELVSGLVAAVRAAFEVMEYAESGGYAFGLTDLECIDLLARYLVWVTDLLEDTRPLATSPAPTGSVPAAASPPASGPGSPSTPTASGPSTNAASPAPSAPPSPRTADADPRGDRTEPGEPGEGAGAARDRG